MGSAHTTRVQLTYQQFDLPLKHVFTISRGSTAVQETLIVELAADGHFGYGEATTNSFYGATIAQHVGGHRSGSAARRSRLALTTRCG